MSEWPSTYVSIVCSRPQCMVVVFRVATGRVRSVVPRGPESPTLEPTPGYDTHICHPQTATNNHVSTLLDLVARDLMFLFEFDDEDCLPVKRPRQCLPYAVVAFEKRTPAVTTTTTTTISSATTRKTFPSASLTPSRENNNNNPSRPQTPSRVRDPRRRAAFARMNDAAAPAHAPRAGSPGLVGAAAVAPVSPSPAPARRSAAVSPYPLSSSPSHLPAKSLSSSPGRFSGRNIFTERFPASSSSARRGRSPSPASGAAIVGPAPPRVSPSASTPLITKNSPSPLLSTILTGAPWSCTSLNQALPPLPSNSPLPPPPPLARPLQPLPTTTTTPLMVHDDPVKVCPFLSADHTCKMAVFLKVILNVF